MSEVTLSFIVEVILKRFWVIFLAAVVFATGAYIYCGHFVDPTYQAKSSIITTNGGIVDQQYASESTSSGTDGSNKIGSADFTSSIYVARTVVDIMQTYNFFEALEKQPEIVAIGYSAAKLKNMSSFDIRSDKSLLVDITVTGNNPEHVVKIANCISNFAPEYIGVMLSNAYALQADRSITATPTGPHTLRNSAIFALAGAIIVSAIFVFFAVSDDTISGEDSITSHFDVHILGTVPNFENTSKKGAK